MIEDILTDLIFFTSPQERSDAPIPINFYVTLHATKPTALVKEINTSYDTNDYYHH